MAMVATVLLRMQIFCNAFAKDMEMSLDSPERENHMMVCKNLLWISTEETESMTSSRWGNNFSPTICMLWC